MAEAGVTALASLVSPFRADRAAARAAHESRGLRFLEVWVSTPLEECEKRDSKGLYARARAGEIPDFTGIGQPYEAPEAPELEVAFGEPLEDAAERVLALLRD
jgi:bifunctional enzyme CysN/CysC